MGRSSYRYAAAGLLAVASVAAFLLLAERLNAADVATLDRTATVQVQPPEGGRTLLQLGVSAFTPPASGSVQAVVTVAAPDGREEEIGRFAVFPVAEFRAESASQQQTFQFDATGALEALRSRGRLEVKVRLVPTDAKAEAAGAELTIGRAEFKPAP